MQRFVPTCAFAIVVLLASSVSGQNIGSGSVTIPASGRPDTPAATPAEAPRAAGGSAINYDTIHLEKRVTAVRAIGALPLDGAPDQTHPREGPRGEAAWREAPVANGFIPNDPREGTAATYDTEVRVLYTDDALYFGVFAHDEEPAKIVLNDLKKDYAKDV